MQVQQPEALRLANVCSNLTRYSMDAHLIAAELLRLHAENESLRAERERNLNSIRVCNEIINKKLDENETLRTGYAAARLEIESLRARSVAPAVTMLGEHAELRRLSDCCPELNLSNYGPDDVDELNGWAIEVSQCIDRALAAQPAGAQQTGAHVALSDAEIDRIVPALEPVSEDFPVEWALWKDRERIRNELRASHGQAPAQAAPELTETAITAKNPAAPVSSFEDSRTQAVYEVLVNDNYPPAGSGEHWEGWKARLIVDALFPIEAPAAGAESASNHAVREAVAKVIYDQWVYKDGWVAWVNGGNSLRQDDARRLADLTLAMAEVAPADTEVLDVLRAFAEGSINHINEGLCPDSITGPNSRDPDCRVCRALDGAAPAAVAGPSEAGFVVELDDAQEARFANWHRVDELTPWQRSVARLALLLNTTKRGLIDYDAAQHFANELMTRTAAPTTQPAPQQEPGKAVHQFRKQHCADWYDGRADHSDGGGPYEERTLYTSPQQKAQKPVLFVSKKQLADLADPTHATGGSYLPARKTRAGLFTQPLYTAPQPLSASQVDALDAARYRYLRDVPLVDWPADLTSIFILQQNNAWDRRIDAARAAQKGK